MKNKRIIFFIIPSMFGGGAEKVLAIILSYLNREKFIPKLVLFKKTGEYLNSIPQDVEVFDLKKKNKLDVFKLIFRLRRIIKYEKPDVLFSFLDYTNVITVLASLFLKNKPRIILSEHNYHRLYLPDMRMKLVRKMLMRFAYNIASKIIAVSKAIKVALIEDFSIKGDSINVIYNPIDINKIRALSGESINHPFFGNANRAPVILGIGRLVKQKNFSLLIKAFADVRKEREAYLIILGQGELKADLKTLASDLGVERYVDLVGFQKNPFAWLVKADLFVLSSQWEGFGIVVIEAMACGVPVISTNCPSGPDEIIVNRKTGILVNSNSVDSMSRAILELIKNEPLRNVIKEEALKYAEKFDAEKIIGKYEELF